VQLPTGTELGKKKNEDDLKKNQKSKQPKNK
jgi:hypothetical protein